MVVMIMIMVTIIIILMLLRERLISDGVGHYHRYEPLQPNRVTRSVVVLNILLVNNYGNNAVNRCMEIIVTCTLFGMN